MRHKSEHTRSFAVAAPTTWNSLPLYIRNSSSIYGFLYNLAFDPFQRPTHPLQRLRFVTCSDTADYFDMSR